MIITLFILFVSIILHEIAHGYTALKLGDPTARNLGRLSLNPIVHIDLFGTIILPALLLFSGAPFFIGWAKPVPVDTRYFKNPLKDMMWVAIAGPLTNITIAILFSLILRLSLQMPLLAAAQNILIAGIYMNLVLALFNLIPIPPLDGSRILMHFLPYRYQFQYARLERYGLLFVFVFAYFGIFNTILRVTLTPLLPFFLP